MSYFGEWVIDVKTDKMPQRVTSAFSALDRLVGSEYMLIAYLGTQEANGINHAVLAEQIVTTGKDTKNVVCIIFNDKPSEDKATLVNIERVVEGGLPLGGLNIDIKTRIPEKAKKVYEQCFVGYVGARVKPFALLATGKDVGTTYVFAARFEGSGPGDDIRVVSVWVNAETDTLMIKDILNGPYTESE